MKSRRFWPLAVFCVSCALVVVSLATLGGDYELHPAIVIAALMSSIAAFFSGYFLPNELVWDDRRSTDNEETNGHAGLENLKDYLEISLSPCLIINQNRQILESNHILESLWGVSRNRLKEAHITFNNHSSSGDVWDIETSQLAIGKSGYLAGELRLRGKVKSLGVFHLTWVGYPGPEDRALFIEIAEPLSEAKFGENRRIEMIEALRLRDDDRTLLKELNHGLRTELHGLLGMIELLRGGPDPKQQTKYLDALDGSTKLILESVDTLIDFFEIDEYSGQAGNVYSIDELLRGLSDTLNRRTDSDTFEVLYDTDRSVFRNVRFPREVLEKLIGHLVAHIVQTDLDGSVIVRPRIFESNNSTTELNIEVLQNSATLPRIKTGSIHDPDKISLDLEIARRLAGAVKGELQAGRFFTDNPGFKLTLKGVVTDDMGAAFVVPNHLKNLRALIIDDNPASREVLQELAHEIGWHADVAASGESALHMMNFKSALDAAYDIVLVDWRMPDIDGWDTSQKIREEIDGGKLPIIVMITAHSHDFMSKNSLDRSKVINGFLTKPVSVTMLLDAVADAMAHKYEPDKFVLASIEKKPEVDMLAGRKILVVDDNAMNLEVAKEFLSLYGAKVITAGGGYGAISTIQSAASALDLVLMDIHMPDLDGLSAVKQIRSLGYLSLPIVIMTANTSETVRSDCFKAGAQDVVQKPFLAKEIAATIASNLRGKPAETSDKEYINLSERTTSLAGEFGIDLKAAIGNFDGSIASYNRALESLVLDIGRVRGQLTEHIPEDVQEDIVRELQTLGGMLSLVGDPKGSAYAKSLANNFAMVQENQSDQDALRQSIAQFVAHLDHVSHIGKLLVSYLVTELGRTSDNVSA